MSVDEILNSGHGIKKYGGIGTVTSFAKTSDRLFRLDNDGLTSDSPEDEYMRPGLCNVESLYSAYM